MAFTTTRAASTHARPASVDLVVDRIACDGFGMCAELLPEIVDLDDWGYPMVRPGGVPDALMDHARRAAAVCPVLALRLVPRPAGAGGSR